MRLIPSLIAALVLALVGVWLLAPDVSLIDLGPGEHLLGRPGTDVLVVGDGAGAWRTLRLGPPGTVEAGWSLPAGTAGRPALARNGRVMARVDAVLEAWEGGVLAEQRPLPAVPSVPSDWSLEGLDGSDQPVLRRQVPAGAELWVVPPSGAGWQALGDGEQPLRLAPDQQIVLSPSRRALAFRGPEGWEARLWDGEPTRAVARRCRGPDAVFTPDGRALLVDGKVKGLYRLELDEDRLAWMAEGNLGLCERVPFRAGFREDPPWLVAPQRDYDGYLQIVQTNLGGGGRWTFSTGFEQHYGPVVSPDGRRMVYAQAEFPASEGDPFRESLYLFDFAAPSRAADELGSRQAGRTDVGPVFVGSGAALVFIADGRVLLLDRRETAPPEDPP